MSSRKRDTIDRVKFVNPLPLPPYPAKLVNTPLLPERYGHPSFAKRLASEIPIPLLYDAEAGIHPDIAGAVPGIWLQDSSTFDLPISVPAPADVNLNDIDATDAFLLQDFSLALQQQPGPSASAAAGLEVGSVKGSAASSSAATAAAVAHHIQNQHNAALGPLARSSLGANDVTWLRRTEYLSAEAKRQRAQEIKQRVQPEVDVSRGAQVKAIAQSFAAVRNAPGGRGPSAAPLSSLKHPNKPGVHAVESFDVLPDPETWATEYQLVRFLDWPGRVSKGGQPVSDPRLDVHLLRPVGHDKNQIISVYMPSGQFGEQEVPSQSEEDIQQEYEEAKAAAESLPEEATEESTHTRAEALTNAETTRTAKLSLYKYIAETQKAVQELNSVEKEQLAAARFAKRRRTGVFPEPVVASEVGGEGEDDLAALAAAEMAAVTNTAYSTKFVYVRDYEADTETGGSSTAGQLIFVFDDGQADDDIVGRLEAPLKEHGLSDSFPAEAQAKYGSVDIVETDPLTGLPKETADAVQKRESETLPPQSRLERAYRAKLIEHNREDEPERSRMGLESRSNLKAAYYHPLSLNFKLRMKRHKKTEKPSETADFWDAVEISQRHLRENEVYLRLNSRKEFDDLDKMDLSIQEEEVAPEGEADAYGEADAEGEVDMDAAGEDVDADADGDDDAEGDAEIEAQLANGTSADVEGEDEEEEEGDKEEDDDEDDDADADEDMDDEELAALRADAEQNGDDVGADSGERSRRSRRSAAAE
ncbi:hypothetical protein OC846_002700 [Tilletia horrida]|uniref:Uncharacterized protein n=1 Tax=Tilletia horrida TaxID=155126 RepID=A0AAN6JRX4_9BASI|nr:hypothetical protein OC846_002700 [Tilletia horrida]KAK0566265.1 hypothetical protein OC861_003344 [Tilletia horrida]